jgi:hypothetical protein
MLLFVLKELAAFAASFGLLVGWAISMLAFVCIIVGSGLELLLF